MKIKAFSMVVLVGLFVAPSAAATLGKGDNEIELSMSYSDLDIGSSSGLDLGSEERLELTLLYGRLLTDGFEIGLLTSYSDQEIDGGDIVADESSDTSSIGAFIAYNFLTGETVIPYLVGTLEIIGGDGGDLYDTAYGAGGGIKIYPFEHGGFRFGVNFTKLNSDLPGLPDGDVLSAGGGLLLKW
jgi:hypothetical protein